MSRKKDLPKMEFEKDGKKHSPLIVTEVNGSYVVAVYKGSLSRNDILIKYRQKIVSGWSRIRTPKHIHWAVDVLIKMNEDPKRTKDFLDFLIRIWKKTQPFRNKRERDNFLDVKKLTSISAKNFSKLSALSRRGEYSIKFLVLLARLLMAQEKTNLKTAYMFKKLLDALRKNEDIFSIVSTATHRGG